ncbi:hypothetical protein [Mycolicibacterium duvalii]|uniref:hypothetical protein n=1 Tax=Mycolicibacterium duvalii TaxID=39688 RepID=UPI0013CFEF39|nr:hypothetical protein [Mycolicibacterium duvalii]MCV7369048.1 hypothetical protein [Mycolicibacterium duvalii]
MRDVGPASGSRVRGGRVLGVVRVVSEVSEVSDVEVGSAGSMSVVAGGLVLVTVDVRVVVDRPDFAGVVERLVSTKYSGA